jgi:hypothetical protein
MFRKSGCFIIFPVTHVQELIIKKQGVLKVSLFFQLRRLLEEFLASSMAHHEMFSMTGMNPSAANDGAALLISLALCRT